MIPFRTFIIAFMGSPRTALGAAWAALRGLRVRSRNMLYAAAHQQPRYYEAWTSIVEPRKIDQYCCQGPSVGTLPPIIALVFGGATSSKKDVSRTVARARAAFAQPITVYCDVPGAGADLGCVEIRKGRLADFLVDIELDNPGGWLFATIAGDEISKDAARVLRRALGSSPETPLIYWDEDLLVGRIRSDPWLKPDWDELLFLGRDFLTGASIIKISALLSTVERCDFSLSRRGISEGVISMVSQAPERDAAFHIPLILSHRSRESTFATAGERKMAIEAHWPEPVELIEIAGIPEALRPRFSMSTPPPKVSVLIPTRNQHELLRVCMQGLAHVNYEGGLEVIVIDNASDEEATLDYLQQLEREGVVVLRHAGQFNFSAINNRAARVATGDLICLLNNDVEMHDGCWLAAMVSHALRPSTAAVGALLQYADGTVQHAGVSVGTGEAAGHVHRGIPLAHAGHRHMHRLTRHVSAVTAACLVIRKEVFFEVGGLDETAFKVAFNDVDFCLKLSRLGYHNVLAGDALLTHHESKSRGSDFLDCNYSRYMNELGNLQEKWRTKEFIDPYGHPLVMRSSERFILAP